MPMRNGQPTLHEMIVAEMCERDPAFALALANFEDDWQEADAHARALHTSEQNASPNPAPSEAS